MTALTADRNTLRRDGVQFEVPMAASTTLYAGALVCRNASGYAVPGSVATTLKALGVCQERITNGATAGATMAKVERGTWKFANSTSTDEITIADVGNTCFVVDDQTVAKTNGSSTRSAAGTVRAVDSDGVWVEF